MAKLSDLKLTHRLFMETYSYRSVDWSPGVALRKPLNEARVALITTAAFFAPGQPPFDTSIRGGDCSYRVLPANVDLTALQIAHRSSAFDIRGIETDKNLALPLDRLKSMARHHFIGAVAPRHFSFMGSIIEPEKLIAETAPEVTRELLTDSVDAVLLTPV